MSQPANTLISSSFYVFGIFHFGSLAVILFAMKSSYIFSNVGFIALLTALSQGSLLPQSFRSLSTRNEFGFDPDVLHGGSAGVDPLAGGYDKFAKDHGNDDSGEGPVDGLGDGDSGGNDKGSGNNGGVTVSNGVVKRE